MYAEVLRRILAISFLVFICEFYIGYCS
eukprot:SAG25_NODE_3585_length_1033_cov_1.182013_1_plen_28_part_01